MIVFWPAFRLRRDATTTKEPSAVSLFDGRLFFWRGPILFLKLVIHSFDARSLPHLCCHLLDALLITAQCCFRLELKIRSYSANDYQADKCFISLPTIRLCNRSIIAGLAKSPRCLSVNHHSNVAFLLSPHMRAFWAFHEIAHHNTAPFSPSGLTYAPNFDHR